MLVQSARDPFPAPSALLSRIASCSDAPVAIALCPDFENKQWRYAQLANHVLDWLPEVALTPSERSATFHEPNKQLARAARRFFDVSDPSKRGEIGEVLLHIACRQEFGSSPLIARLFYKMRTNDSVTSVDVAHVVYHEHTDELELWLGEAKLYDNIDAAKYAALRSIKNLWDYDAVKELKALVGPKIGSDHKLANKLEWLFWEETSLDQIVDRIVIPICIAADFIHTKSAENRSQDYLEAVLSELTDLQKYFADRIPSEVQYVCIFIPMDCKENLEKVVNLKIQALLV